MGRLLPYQINGDVNVGIVAAVNIVSIPVDHLLSREDMAKLSPSSLPPTLAIDNTDVVNVVADDKAEEAS